MQYPKKEPVRELFPISPSQEIIIDLDENYHSPIRLNRESITKIYDTLIELLALNYENFVLKLNFDNNVEIYAYNICRLLRRCLKQIEIYPFNAQSHKMVNKF
jgi:hypothetical protein